MGLSTVLIRVGRGGAMVKIVIENYHYLNMLYDYFYKMPLLAGRRLLVGRIKRKTGGDKENF